VPLIADTISSLKTARKRCFSLRAVFLAAAIPWGETALKIF
jgi:hypothetical protein